MSETTIQKQNGTGGTPQAGMIQRQEFGAAQLARSAELATAAVAAQAKAEVEARYVMALQRPRDWDEVRVKLLKDCARPVFAEVAIYSKPIGGSKIQGPSIRFVEAALRAMGNVIAPTMIVFEDRERRIIRVSVTDLESNVTYPTDILVEKTVERRDPKGREVISRRENSTGQTTYTVLATDDELLVKQGALQSKAIRTNGLRALPGDLVEEGLQKCRETLKNRAAKDPEEEKRKIIDAFEGVGVTVAELRRYLGHPLDHVQPAELVDLREVFGTIKDGETTWREVIEQKLASLTTATQAPPAPDGSPPTPAENLAAAAEATQSQTPTPPAVDPRVVDFEAKLRATKPGKERITLMREVGSYPAEIQAACRDTFNRVTEEEAARG